MDGGGKGQNDRGHPEIPADEWVSEVGLIRAAFVLHERRDVKLEGLQREEQSEAEGDVRGAKFLFAEENPANQKKRVGEDGEVEFEGAEDAGEHHLKAGVVNDTDIRTGILMERESGNAERDDPKQKAGEDEPKPRRFCGSHAEKCIAGVRCCRKRAPRTALPIRGGVRWRQAFEGLRVSQLDGRSR